MNSELTIKDLGKYNGLKKENFHLYSKDEYVLYTASIMKYNEFIDYCANNKTILPQICLYVYFIANDISMCDMCLQFGCNIDEICVSFACLFRNLSLIEYCAIHHLNPTENDIKDFLLEQKTCTEHINFSDRSTKMLNKQVFFDNFSTKIIVSKIYVWC